MTEFCDIQKLAELFKIQRKEDDSDDDEDISTNDAGKSNNLNNVDAEAHSSKKKNPYGKLEKKPDEEIKTSEAEYAEEEVEKYLEKESGSSSDWWKCPQWEISYRQEVTPSDVFLQMGGKNPGTASCEDMLISVHLPGEDRSNIDLKVTKDHLDLVSPKFRLGIPLPHPVDPQKGNAQWDKESEKITITLVMDREFDFINF